jgi:hypothetical protein
MTRIYGASDNIIEFEGDVSGEVNHYGEDNEEILIICSDGTLLAAKYGKLDLGIWAINVIQAGSLFKEHQTCSSENADPYSDVVTFHDGLRWAFAATEWERVH